MRETARIEMEAVQKPVQHKFKELYYVPFDLHTNMQCKAAYTDNKNPPRGKMLYHCKRRQGVGLPCDAGAAPT